MKVAALYDVHGNAPALEAVLADGAADADAIVFGGDLIWGAWPRETLELARSFGDKARFIMGNTDRRSLTEDDDPSGLWVQERLDEEAQSFVLSWPVTVALDEALYCHGTPRSDTEVVTPVSPESFWNEVLAGVAEEIVVCGHFHYQYDERHGGHRVVNAGSVGNPTVRPVAWWAMLDGGQVELRTTEYDTRATAQAWLETGFPRTDFVDELLEPESFEQLLARVS